MRPIAESEWPEAYRETARSLRSAGAASRLILSGCSACVDRLVTLAEAAPLLLASEDAEAVLLGRELLRRAAAGIGGEVLFHSKAAITLPDRLGAMRRLGGTAAQAAYALAQLGAPVLLALEDRSAEQLELLHPEILIATEDGLTRAAMIAPCASRGRLPHLIVEYAEGQAVAGIVPPRSTRVIVRFADDGMEHDPHFIAASRRLAAAAGCGILGGFNAIPAAAFGADLAEAAGLADSWRAAGLASLHLELGDFVRPADRGAVLGALAGRCTSLGMSFSELCSLLPGEEPVRAKAKYLAETLGLERVAIHADAWALTLTRSDPWHEQEALLAGCLLAASRAALGRPHVPDGPPAGARFRLPHPAFAEEAGWYAVACPAPWLARPASTIGLGDTFVAGTMLALGRRRHEPASHPDIPIAEPERS